MSAPTELLPIPSPPGLPLLGHVHTIDRVTPSRSFALLAKAYGPIYTINFFGKKRYIVGSQELINELCNEKRFHKTLSPPLEQVRNGAGDGLFTAYHGEENWGLAHRILMPAFGPGNIRDMFDDMLDINSQLLLKWERYGPEHAIDPADDFSRMAFDTIALTVMSYRFNSFYSVEPPPFIMAMGRFLIESGMRTQRSSVVQSLMIQANSQYAADIKLMVDVCDGIVAYRKAHPTDKKDLLNLMLYGKDPKTGRSLPETNIRNQMISFLSAGHETTSGMLSFAIFYLLSNPSAYAALQQEIDTVVGTSTLQLSHLPELKYTTAVLRETLRVSPTVPMFTVAPFEDTVIGGRYLIEKDVSCACDLHSVHRDPKVWGEDADEFKPERMLNGKFEALPPNSWKPFGNGSRACIGRPVAWQEAIMMLATLFQKFDLRLDDPAYQMQIRQTLTVKPEGMFLHAVPRSGSRPVATSVAPASHSETQTPAAMSASAPTGQTRIPLYVYFGSNSGTCEGFAQSVVTDARSKGFEATIATLDSVENALPTDGPVVILTASYEGQPADNAAHFIEWIKRLTGKALEGVKYAVFGAGHHDWVQTYQAIPTLVDNTLFERGATRLIERFAADAGGSDLFGEFDKWELQLWHTLTQAYRPRVGDTASQEEEDDLVVVVTGTSRKVRLRQPDLSRGKVIENRLLTAPGAAQKRHIEFELPASMEYHPGDYLAVLPTNPAGSVKRVLKHFNLEPDTKVAIKSKGPTTLPTDEPISFHELFSGYVELGQPATKRNIEELAKLAPPESGIAEKLRALAVNHSVEVVDKHLSVLDLLEMFPAIDLPLNLFIKQLPSMRIRQYSISSSPLWKADHCTLTVSVIQGPSTEEHEAFLGVASNYLANLQPGDDIGLAVRPSAAAFHLPADPATPIVMFCAGSGFAPMRGFIQERAQLLAAGHVDVGKALLFVGCRAPDEDFLYSGAELAEWIKAGAVDVRTAFSRQPAQSQGCKYVQDRVWRDREDVKAAFRAGARLYTCGMSGMSNSVRQKCVDMSEEKQCSEEEAVEFFGKMVKERYSTDVFG